jgi:hypothetical protein
MCEYVRGLYLWGMGVYVGSYPSWARRGMCCHIAGGASGVITHAFTPKLVPPASQRTTRKVQSVVQDQSITQTSLVHDGPVGGGIAFDRNCECVRTLRRRHTYRPTSCSVYVACIACCTTGPRGIDLKPGMAEDYDYKLLEKAAYDLLRAWYSEATSGGRRETPEGETVNTVDGPHFPRAVVQQGSEALAVTKVELYPFVIDIAMADDATGQPLLPAKPYLFSRTGTLLHVFNRFNPPRPAHLVLECDRIGRARSRLWLPEQVQSESPPPPPLHSEGPSPSASPPPAIVYTVAKGTMICPRVPENSRPLETLDMVVQAGHPIVVEIGRADNSWVCVFLVMVGRVSCAS